MEGEALGDIIAVIEIEAPRGEAGFIDGRLEDVTGIESCGKLGRSPGRAAANKIFLAPPVNAGLLNKEGAMIGDARGAL